MTDPDNPNGQVKDYTVNYYPTAIPDLSQSYTTPNYLPQATISGLLPSTPYSFIVIAESIVGEGNQSEPSEVANGTTSSALPHNIWDIPAAICTDPLELGFDDLISYVSNILGLKKIFIEYVKDDRLESPLSDYINAIQASLGGESILSFGKLTSLIETTTSDLAEILAFYEDKITSFNLDYINFTLGFDFIYEPTYVQNHIATVAQLLQNHPTLKISYTMPVNAGKSPDELIVATGLDEIYVSFLANLDSAGVKPTLINASSTQGYPSLTNNILQDIKASIDGSGTNGEYDVGLKAQLKNIYNISDADAYKMIGISPKFGENTNGLVFNLVDQAGLITYKTLHNIGNLNGENISIDMNLSSEIGLPFSFSQLLGTILTIPITETDDNKDSIIGDNAQEVQETL